MTPAAVAGIAPAPALLAEDLPPVPHPFPYQGSKRNLARRFLHSHLATREIRRLDIQWSGEEIADHDLVQREAQRAGETMPEFVKRVLRSHLAARTES